VKYSIEFDKSEQILVDLKKELEENSKENFGNNRKKKTKWI